MKISLVFPAFVAGLILAGGAGRAADWDRDQLNVQLLSPEPQTVAFKPCTRLLTPRRSPIALQIQISGESPTIRRVASSYIGALVLAYSPPRLVQQRVHFRVLVPAGCLQAPWNWLSYI